MSAVDAALRTIHYSIPPEILKRVFSTVFEPQNRGFYLTESAIRAAIQTHVIDGRVRPDCDTMNVTQVDIPLAGIVPQIAPPRSAIFKIPKDATGGRIITSVSALIYSTNFNSVSNLGYSLGGNSWLTGQTPMQAMARRSMESMAPIPESETPYVSIIGENVIAVEGYLPRVHSAWLRCHVGNDTHFSTLPQPYWLSFAELCLRACKAFIYNFYVIEMDEGVLSGGRELGAFKEIIQEYRDANELYTEYLNTTWRKQTFLADPKRKARNIRSMLGASGG